MRESASESKSASNFLSQCLVESDPAARAAGRRTRFASVGASLLMQAVLLTVLIIVPLFAAGKLPAMRFDAPTPIFRGGDPGAPPPVQQPNTGGTSHGPHRPEVDVSIRQPRVIPDRVIEDVGFEPTHSSSRGCRGCPVIEGAPLPDIGFDSGRRTPLPEMPPPPAPRAPVKVHERIMEARLIHRVMPIYPALPRQIGRNGQVVMRAIIGTDGSVHSLEFVSGDPMFWTSARDAVLRWRYTPTLLNGQPIEVETVVTVTYEIKRY